MKVSTIGTIPVAPMTPITAAFLSAFQQGSQRPVLLAVDQQLGEGAALDQLCSV